MAIEIGRRLVHASGAIIPGAYLYDTHVLQAGLVTWSVIQVLITLGLVLTGVLEGARLYGGFEHPLFDRLARDYEQHTIAGYALYVLGATITVFAFEPMIAVPALFMLTLCDPVSGMLSSGELRTIARPHVLLGMFIVSFLVAYPFVATGVAVAGAVGASFADGIKPRILGYVVDDNLTIPLLGALGMWAAQSVL